MLKATQFGLTGTQGEGYGNVASIYTFFNLNTLHTIKREHELITRPFLRSFQKKKWNLKNIIVLNIFVLKLVIKRKSPYLPDMKETIWNLNNPCCT